MSTVPIPSRPRMDYYPDRDKDKKARVVMLWSDKKAKHFYRLFKVVNKGCWFKKYVWEMVADDTWSIEKANRWAAHYNVKIEKNTKCYSVME